MIAVPKLPKSNTDRTVAAGIQHSQTAQLARLQAASSRHPHARASAGRQSEIMSDTAIGEPVTPRRSACLPGPAPQGTP